MASSTDPAKPSIDFNEPAPKKRPVRNGIIVVAVLAALAIVIGGFVIRSKREKAHARQVAHLNGEWGTLQGCLLGEPLKEGEGASSRFRAIQLDAVGVPKNQRAKNNKAPWPRRCANYAAAIAKNAEVAPGNAQDLTNAMEALAKELDTENSVTADLGKLIDQAWKDAAAAGLEAKPGNPAAAPKPLAPLLGDQALHTPSGIQGDFALTSVKVDPAPTSNVRFLIDDSGLTGGPALCSVSGQPQTLVCAHLGGEVAARAPGLSLLGTTDAAAHPWIFAGDRGQLGIYRPSGTLAMKGQHVLGSSVGPDDTAFFVVHVENTADTDLRMLHVPLTGDAPPPLPILDAPEVGRVEDLALAWNWLVLKAGPHAHFANHLVAHQVQPTGALGPALDIGDAATLLPPPPADGEARLTLCKDGANIALRLHGATADAMAFYTGTAWTAPVALAKGAGELACHGNEATVTNVLTPDSAPVVEQARCNASGCTLGRTVVKELLGNTDVMPEGGGSFAATEVGGKLLLVWNAGSVGGIRMRLAPPDKLKVTPDAVVVDSMSPDGKSGVTALRLLPTGDSALLFVKTKEGARVFSVDGTGKVSVLQTTM